MLTKLHGVVEAKKVTPLEQWSIQFFKELSDMGNAEFSCPGWSISYRNNPKYYRAAKQVREMALEYATG